MITASTVKNRGSESARNRALCTVSVWNTRTPTEKSWWFGPTRAALCASTADIIVLAEGNADTLPPPPFGHTITSEFDPNCRIPSGCRKVVLWSRESWHEVDQTGDANLPVGRFVCGTTRTPAGNLTIVGVCIPYVNAHVNVGRRDRRPWDEHLRYLAALDNVLQRNKTRVLVAGDWNQRVPRSNKEPLHVADALEHTFRRMNIVTRGLLQPLNVRVIEHVAISGNLKVADVECWNKTHNGRPISDHSAGVTVTVHSA
jgi:hypothetical protein